MKEGVERLESASHDGPWFVRGAVFWSLGRRCCISTLRRLHRLLAIRRPAGCIWSRGLGRVGREAGVTVRVRGL